MGVAVNNWAEQIRAGDVRAISRAITAVENREAEAEELLRSLFTSTGQAYVIGLTGAPGTGKSSLVDRLAAFYRREGKSVGIIAVDPSSAFTGGAILGDRIRMQGHATDAGIYIRSMATRGFLGGLARATSDVALLLDAAGKQVVLIETVGVGQDEIDIVRLADSTLVLLVPGLGDDVQNMKAGLMEIGDIFVLNKADREGADRLEQQILAMLNLVPEREGWKPPVVRTVATEDKGTEALASAVADFRSRSDLSRNQEARKIAHWKQRLVGLIEARLLERVVSDPQGEETLDQLAREVAERKKDPYAAVNEVLARAGIK
ncbi:MAG TPA: methylmalonyl Co-A mutase-associated GTPase MeaB [Candidatus Acidoferrales bacterium]|nr:methylmalonyl Co-A mutase-associated GTPase MeaB [Candidatus Acidoferrales bacterium]